MESLIDLLDDGWFGGQATDLTTIQEVANEVDETEDEDEGAVADQRFSQYDRTRSSSINEGTLEAACDSFRRNDSTCDDAACSRHSRCEDEGSSAFRSSVANCPDCCSCTACTSCTSSSRGHFNRSQPHCYSPEPEGESSYGRYRRRRGRPGHRRRGKRSSSADRVRDLLMADGAEARTPRPLDTAAGAEPQDDGNKSGTMEQALFYREPRNSAGSGSSSGRKGKVLGDRRYLRTRSVSDYEAEQRGDTSAFWEDSSDATERARSLTEADVEELKGFVDLGFTFRQHNISPRMTATLPALRLYQHVGSVQRRLISRKSAANAPSSSSSSSSLPHDSPVTDACSSPRQPSVSDPWVIANPNDPPADVKTNLRLWAQAVASTVRQTC